jgi:hypothetical protein
MSQTVNTAFVQQFRANLELLVQQKGSMLLPHVNVEHIVGKFTHFDRLGAGEASEVLTRHGDTPSPLNLEHSRRRCILRTFDAAEMVDRADKVRMLIDPTNEYAQSISNALGRKIDDLILIGLYGNAYAVSSADAQTTVALTDLGSGQQVIDEDIGTANSDLIVAKLRAARKRLLKNNVDLGAEQAMIVHDSTAIMDGLLTETSVTSSDFNTVKALVNGELNTFMGFKFVLCERLADTQHLTSEGFARAIVFVPSAIGVAKGDDVEIRIDERADKRYSTQVYGRFDYGAVRRQEEKVVVIECYRT